MASFETTTYDNIYDESKTEHIDYDIKTDDGMYSYFLWLQSGWFLIAHIIATIVLASRFFVLYFQNPEKNIKLIAVAIILLYVMCVNMHIYFYAETISTVVLYWVVLVFIPLGIGVIIGGFVFLFLKYTPDMTHFLY